MKTMSVSSSTVARIVEAEEEEESGDESVVDRSVYVRLDDALEESLGSRTYL